MATNQQELIAQITAAVVQEVTKAGTVQVQAAEAAPQRKRNSIAPKVVVNTGTDAEKYGDVTIGKPRGNGFIPGVGVDVEHIDGLIKALRAAKKEVTAQG